MVDPVWCKNNRWIIVKAAIINGNKKWIIKNRFNVALSTAKPPHNHWTMGVPNSGIVERRLVITVAPQKDIWPHGNTYPINAVPIVINNRITPIVQVSIYLNDW